jgi:hypothetical protein
LESTLKKISSQNVELSPVIPKFPDQFAEFLKCCFTHALVSSTNLPESV